MSQPEFLSTSSLTPKKLVLIVVLVGILGFVLFFPEEESSEFNMPMSRRSTQTVTRTSLQKASDNLHAPVDWPDVNLERVLATNPFETIFVKKQEKKATEEPVTKAIIVQPVVAEQVMPAEVKMVIEHRRHDEVEIIYENVSGRVAVIRSKRVREGDVLPEGRVVEITPNHVIVAVEVPVDPESGESASDDPALDKPALNERLPEIPAA